MSRRDRNPLVIPMLRTGAVTLRSGEWVWQLDKDGDRFRLLFRRTNEFGEEMVAYCRRATVTTQVVAAHARSPLYRSWTDAEGEQWSMRLEAPASTWMSTRSGAVLRGDQAWIVFDAGVSRRFAWVPGDTALGELSHREIARLMEDSEPSSVIGRTSCVR